MSVSSQPDNFRFTTPPPLPTARLMQPPPSNPAPFSIISKTVNYFSSSQPIFESPNSIFVRWRLFPSIWTIHLQCGMSFPQYRVLASIRSIPNADQMDIPKAHINYALCSGQQVKLARQQRNSNDAFVYSLDSYIYIGETAYGHSGSLLRQFDKEVEEVNALFTCSLCKFVCL